MSTKVAAAKTKSDVITVCLVIMFMGLEAFIVHLHSYEPASDAPSSLLLSMIIFGGMFIVYILPTIVACVYFKESGYVFFLANLIFGWTLFGWALLWLCFFLIEHEVPVDHSERRSIAVYVVNPPQNTNPN